MILNIMGLLGNFGTVAMTVVNSLGTYWELRGNSSTETTRVTNVPFEFIYQIWLVIRNAPTMSFTEILGLC